MFGLGRIFVSGTLYFAAVFGFLAVVVWFVWQGYAISTEINSTLKADQAAATAEARKVTEAKAKPPEKTAEQKAEEAADEARFQKDVAVVKIFRAAMKNPASFRLEEALRMDDGTLCLSYRAANSFNAIVPGKAVVTRTTIVTSDTRESFAPIWNKRCANKSGRVITYIQYAF